MVQIEKTDLIDSLILPTILLQFNYILGEWKSSQCHKMVLHSIPDLSVDRFCIACFMSFFHGKTVGKIQKWLGEFTVNHC